MQRNVLNQKLLLTITNELHNTPSYPTPQPLNPTAARGPGRGQLLPPVLRFGDRSSAVRQVVNNLDSRRPRHPKPGTQGSMSSRPQSSAPDPTTLRQTALRRCEGLAKLTGQEVYVDDLPLDNPLWAFTVRSPVARGQIRELRFGAGVDWDEVVVVDHRTIPGDNVIALIDDDQPILAVDQVRHIHQPILLVAHPSRAVARRAAAAVEVVIDSEPAVLDFRQPPGPEQLQHGDDNIFKHIVIDKGDTATAFAAAPIVVEGTYETGAQEHVYLETQGMAAWLDGDVVVVQGSIQCPFYVEKALRRGLGRGPEGVRVIQAGTGGGFGGKEEFPSGLALHAALLALKSRRPVKLIYERSEDLAASTKRHPSRVRYRTAVDADGRLLAQEVDILLDAGAYATLSAVVLGRAVIHAGGPYHCENVHVEGRAVLSNAVPYGAFRGFGAPQAHFATERHMDRIAARLGLDPAELRRRNLLREGQSTATSQRIADGADRQAVLDRALEMIGWSERRAAHQKFNHDQPWRRRGVGLAMFHHGAGFTGAGEVFLDSRVEVASRPGGIEIRTAATEMGQGTTTIFTQLATDRLGLEAPEIEVARPDTHQVPNSGPTVASRTAMIVGRLVEEACDDLRRCLGLEAEDRGAAVRQALADHYRRHPNDQLVGHARYRQPPHIDWDDDLYRGDAYGVFAWAAYAAEVEIDLRTYTARVLDFVAVQDVGKVLHGVLARGQIQGGVVQGIGWALLEDCRFENGAMTNAQMTNYIIPTAEDVPPIRVDFLEFPYAHGAQGCKGIGELPMDGPAPAIANAIANAIGRQPMAIPLTPERLMELIEHEPTS